MGHVAPLPTLRQELDRKTLETLDWLFTGLSNGRFTPEQFSMGVDTIFMTVSGLVDKDFINMITLAGKMCDDMKKEAV